MKREDLEKVLEVKGYKHPRMFGRAIKSVWDRGDGFSVSFYEGKFTVTPDKHASIYTEEKVSDLVENVALEGETITIKGQAFNL